MYSLVRIFIYIVRRKKFAKRFHDFANFLYFYTSIKLKIMIAHINEVVFDGTDPWTIAFNKCSALFKESMDETKSEEERAGLLKEWQHQRILLELGIF